MASRTRLSTAAVVTILLAGSSVLVVASPAAAVGYPVTDEATLIAAINASNASTTVDDTISITGTIILTADLPVITDSVQLVGTGSGATINAFDHATLVFDGASGSRLSVVVQGMTINDALTQGISSTGTNLTLENVHIVSAVDDGILAGDGDLTINNSSFTSNETGANLQNAGNTVRITNSAFDDNVTYDGLAVFTSGGGTTVMTGVTADSNRGSGVFLITDGLGSTAVASELTTTNSDFDSGVYLFAMTGASVSLSDVTSTGNQVAGVYADASAATIGVSNITANNNALDGVGVNTASDAVVTVSAVAAAGNATYGVSAAADSGSRIDLSGITATTSGSSGVYLFAATDSRVSLSASTISANDNNALQISGTDSTVSVQSTTIDSNDMLTSGSPLAALRVNNNSDLDVLIDGVTVSNNDRDGAAINATLGSGSVFRLVNSTVSGNTGRLTGTGVEVLSQDAAVLDATAQIENTTLTDNESAIPGFGAGLYVADVITSVRNSIIAGNTADEIQVDDRFGTVEALTANYSLVQSADATGDAALAAGTGNIVGVSAQLAPLANNGGPTRTHAPLTGSPALNAGDPSAVGAPATDQRGLTRIVSGRIDIGAVEAQLPSALAATGVELTAPIGIGTLLLLAGAVLMLRRKARAAH